MISKEKKTLDNELLNADFDGLPGGTETILLAEDEDENRTLLKIILEENGYTVIEARDGSDALRKITTFADSINLIILDVVMPGKNGVHVHTAAKSIIPDVKAIFISGYVSDTVCRQYLMGETMNFLDKPITPLTLLKKVREVLDAPRYFPSPVSEQP